MNTTKKTGRAPYFVKHPKLEEFERLFTNLKSAAAILKEAKEQVGIAKGTLPHIYQARRGVQHVDITEASEHTTSNRLRETRRFALYEVRRAIFCVRIKELHVQQRLLREFIHTNGAALLQQLTLTSEDSIFKFNVINAAQLLQETEEYALLCVDYNETLPIFPDVTCLETRSMLKLVQDIHGLANNIVLVANQTPGAEGIEATTGLLEEIWSKSIVLKTTDCYSTFQFFDCVDKASAAAVTNLQHHYYQLHNALRLVQGLTEKLAQDAGASAYNEWKTHGLIAPEIGIKAVDYELHRTELVRAVGNLKPLLVDSHSSVLKAYLYYANNPQEAQDVSGDDLIVFEHNLMCLGKLLAEGIYNNSLHYTAFCQDHYHSVSALSDQYEISCGFLDGRNSLKKPGILSQAEWYTAKGSDWYNMMTAVQSDESINRPLAYVIVTALKNLIGDGGLGQETLCLVNATSDQTNLIEPASEWFTQAGWNVDTEFNSDMHHGRLILLPA